MKQKRKLRPLHLILPFLAIALTSLFFGVGKQRQPDSRPSSSVSKAAKQNFVTVKKSESLDIQVNTPLLKAHEDSYIAQTEPPISQPSVDEIVQSHMAEILSSSRPERATIDAINALPFPEDTNSRIKLIKKVLESRAVKPAAVAYVTRSELFSRLVYDEDSVGSPEEDADRIVDLFNLYVDSKIQADVVNKRSDEETTREIATNLGEFLEGHPNAKVRDILAAKLPAAHPDLCGISAGFKSAKLQDHLKCGTL